MTVVSFFARGPFCRRETPILPPIPIGIYTMAVWGPPEGLFPIRRSVSLPGLLPLLAPVQALSTSFEKTCKSRLRGCFSQDWPCARAGRPVVPPCIPPRPSACTGTGLVHTFANKRPPSCLRGSLEQISNILTSMHPFTPFADFAVLSPLSHPQASWTPWGL